MPPLLPLFPLDLVLFPKASVPLHIFEPRYREMLGECLPEKRAFGIVCAKKGDSSLATVGCTAEVRTVLNRYDDGRLDILVQGRRRFEILELDHQRAFIRANVLFFDDAPDLASAALIEEALRLNAELLALTESHDPGLTAEHPELSFAIATNLPADLDFKQSLLVMRSEKERINRLVEYYRLVLPKLRLITRARKKAGENGHII